MQFRQRQRNITAVTRERTNRTKYRRSGDKPKNFRFGSIADNHDGTVTVRETWDASEAKIFGFIPAAPVFRRVGVFARNRRNIGLSLAKLHRTFEG